MRIKLKLVTAFIAAGIICSVSAPGVHAQSTDRMQAAYARFSHQTQIGEDQETTLNSLYECYSEAFSITNANPTDSPVYINALSVLTAITPSLQNGVAYYNHLGDNRKTALFAGAFVDAAMVKGMGNRYIENQNFTQFAYLAGTVYMRDEKYEQAARYINAYLQTVGIQSKLYSQRKNAYMCMAQCQENAGDIQGALRTYQEVTTAFPSDYLVLSTVINFCYQNEEDEQLQYYLKKAIAMQPDDKKVKLIQGQLYEKYNDYEKALDLYNDLAQTNPNDISVLKHLAINKYNLGVQNYNSSLLSKDGKEIKELNQKAEQYFLSSITSLKNVLSYDPTLSDYTTALAIAYKCTGDKANLELTNLKLASMGAGRISDDYIPTVLSENNNTGSKKASESFSRESQVTEIPSYSEYAKAYIENIINKWQKKDPYETVTEYQARVSGKNRDDKIRAASKEAETRYINTYSRRISHNDLFLKPYDAENGAFLIESDFGQMVVPVPRDNHEAQMFESNWMSTQFKDAKFCVANDHLALASLTFATPIGKEYRYDNAQAAEYSNVQINAQFEEIDASLLAGSGQGASSKQKVSNISVNVGGSSDVDENIPKSSSENDKLFAVIIANEDYESTAHVPMAVNDGSVFKDYCTQAFGVPESHVRLYKNASYGVMIRAVRDIQSISEAYNGDINILFYYAGHGIPDESTKEAYLLPIDADGRQTEGCYSLARLYSELESTHANQVTVFLDACFSGSNRGDGMLASARGVALKVKKEEPHGNLTIFSAASDDETAFPYTEKSHGLFTYYLLKGIKEYGGNVTLGELSDYVKKNVMQQSIVINRKPQTPVVSPSTSTSSDWRTWKLN